jgi:ABC-2 type transport system permease protein
MVAPEHAAPATPISPDGAASGRYGEIFDRGYKHYDGPRLGRRHAIWALVFYSIKRAMGIKKSWTAKVIPILLYVAVAIPVAVGVGLQAFVDDAEVFDYVGFFGFIFIIEGIFVATVAPEMICGDRRENVLPLYFSRAITRADYVLAKLGATALLTLSISLVPVFVYWLGVQLLDSSPLQAIADTRGDLGAILATGTLIALYLGSIGLAISSFTGRKSIAVAIIIIGFLISTSLAYALYEALDGDERRYTVFLSPSDTIEGLGVALFNNTSSQGELSRTADFSAGVYAAVMLGVTGVATAIMYLRYRPNE